MLLREDQNILIEQLYREMYHQLFTYARSALNDVSFAEEAVQDTFRIACAKITALETSPNPKGWLLNVLKNVIRNMRRSQIQITKLAMEAMMHDSVTAPEGSEHTVDLMYSDVIPREEFLLLKRIALERLTMLELSQELGISVEACKKRVQRARNKMKKELEKTL